MKITPGVSLYEDAKIRRETLQHTFHELLQQTFLNAVHQYEEAILSNNPNLQQALANAFEPYQYTIGIIRMLEDSGRRIIPKDMWLDKKWYNKTEADVYSSLSDAVKSKLQTGTMNNEK